MGLFSKKPPKLPSYEGVGLAQLLADPVWAEAIKQAGIDIARCEFIERVPDAMAMDSNRFVDEVVLVGSAAIVLAQGSTLGLAVPLEHVVAVLTHPASRGSVRVTRSDGVMVKFGPDDTWMFESMKRSAPEGGAFGDALHDIITRA